MTGKPMTFEAWWEYFKPLKNHLSDNCGGPFITSGHDDEGGRLFETYGDEMEYVRSIAKQDPGRVWTLLDVDGFQVIGSGLHFVNRVGYFVTEVAFEGAFLDVNVDDEEDLADGDDLDDEESFESVPASKRPQP